MIIIEQLINGGMIMLNNLTSFFNGVFIDGIAGFSLVGVTNPAFLISFITITFALWAVRKVLPV